MIRFKFLFCFYLVLSSFYTSAQSVSSDSTEWDKMLETVAEETVITATRADRSLSSATVPTLVIQGQVIQQTGLIKLQEILQEQTGLMVTGAAGGGGVGGGVFGNGIQVQGFSPEYTLIMLDGEPIIGRQGGVLDLSRFTAGNIRKIEIVKGPSSALYGSEAMGGVVNILSDQKRENRRSVSVRYGSFNTFDILGSFNQEYKKSSLFFFTNYNHSDGYDLTPETTTQTMDPRKDYTGQMRWTYRFSDKTRLIWNNRLFRGKQASKFMVDSGETEIFGHGFTTDVNINPVLMHRWSESFQSTVRLYGSYYQYKQSLLTSQNEAYYQDNFTQQYFRLEQQNDWDIMKNLTLIAGFGLNHQTVETVRYRRKQFLDAGYVFSQLEFTLRDKWIIIPGLRYDINSAFANRLSPKISARYQVSPNSRFTMSYGSGFKAPDFRQLYLSYVNPAAQGYRVYGAEEFSMLDMEAELAAGIISQILPEAYQIGKLLPEISHGFNVGYHRRFASAGIRADVNVFYNDIQNLINYLPVALQSKGTFVFSYKNTKRAFTAGVECNVSGKIGRRLEWSTGYQFLFTGEQAILRQIADRKVYGRPGPNFGARIMTLSDYTGLLGRSPHMANLKCTYVDPEYNWSGSLRLMYRSRRGVVDLDGNGFANMDEEFSRGFFNLNMSMQKTFYKKVTAQIAWNNILNHRDEIDTPNMPGMHVMCTMSSLF